MTFDELVKKVAAKHEVSEKRTRRIIRDALALARDAAFKTNDAPRFDGIGRFVAKPVRCGGRKPDGTPWTAEPRMKLGLQTRLLAPMGKKTGESADVIPS